jgi:hypothetical protein
MVGSEHRKRIECNIKVEEDWIGIIKIFDEEINYVKLIHYENATDLQQDEIVVTIDHGGLGGASATDAPAMLMDVTRLLWWRRPTQYPW